MYRFNQKDRDRRAIPGLFPKLGLYIPGLFSIKTFNTSNNITYTDVYIEYNGEVKLYKTPIFPLPRFPILNR